MIDYQKMKSGDKSLLHGHFQYEGRYIWYYATTLDEKKSVTVFLDDELRCRNIEIKTPMNKGEQQDKEKERKKSRK